MRRAIALILLTVILLMTGFVHAQDDSITATVAVENANIRWMPETFFHHISDIDSRVGELHAGDTIILHRWENYGSPDRVRVYATHPASGLTGWIQSDLLTIHSETWQRDLPAFRTLAELAAFVTQTAPNGLQAYVSGGNGGYDRLNVRAEPYFGGEKIGEIFTGSTVTILGRALTNDVPLVYVYVRDNHTGVEGWVIQDGLYSFGFANESRNPGLPTLYEVHPLDDTIDLPRFRPSQFNLRDAPSLDARIRYYVGRQEFYAAAGRSTDGEWVNIIDLSSGEQGWIAVSVIAPRLLDIDSLPVVE